SAQPRSEAFESPVAKRSADALNQYLSWAHSQLSTKGTSGDGPPINFLITKWAGPTPHYEPFAERWGMRAASLPDAEVVSGRMLDAIEALETGMETYWQLLAPDPDLITVLTTDHTTPSVWRHHSRAQFSDQHSGEEVPLAIRGGNVRVDAVKEFGERAAASGA